MGNLVFQATLGGQVNLVGPNTASTYNINVPAIAGTLVTTGDTGTVTNTMLAGSIANAKLLNSSVTIGSTSVSLGSTVTAFAGITTLSMSSDLTLSGGTANGVAYLNGSKVVTTGSALVFDGTNLGLGTATPNNYSGYKTLTINGTATTGGGEIDFADGGTTRGSVFSTNTGFTISSYSSVPLLFALNGSEQMRLTSTGLGIGTSSPANKLDVLSTSFAIARFSRSGAGGSAGIDIVEGSGGYSRLATPGGTSNMSFRPGGTELMLLDSSGNLGIGTSSPSQKLEVSGNAKLTAQANLTSQLIFGPFGGTNARIRYDDAAATLFLGTVYAYPLIFATNDTERARIDSSGNLGIGTTSPNASAILDAQSTTKGVRFPNMTGTQKNAISSPPAGLVVFDTTLAKLCVYSGSAWQTITSI